MPISTSVVYDGRGDGLSQDGREGDGVFKLEETLTHFALRSINRCTNSSLWFRLEDGVRAMPQWVNIIQLVRHLESIF